MHETCLIIIHDPGIRPGPESDRGPLDYLRTVKLKAQRETLGVNTYDKRKALNTKNI